ncbi:MAG TPA: OmpA family protein [Bacteroidia bacterium]|jgi:outer membrane protein OmpA-like peptidoglycan-associated protein|nr:OmpA family protein [Bacteroidia bacterium]
MFRSFLFALCIVSFGCFSQKKADTLRLYYAINETASQHNFSRIDSAIKALNGKLIDVGIFGYADFLSDDKYNIMLSQKRADAVRKYLETKAPPSQMNIYTTEGKGETFSKDNSSPEGEPKQRRVDIYFEPVTVINISEARLETPKDSAPKPESKKKIEELNTGESLAIEGLSFVPGRHLILQSSVPALQKLLKTLKNNPKLKVEIQGHVCCTNNGEDGVDYDTREPKLSENRAKAIYEYLIDKGISKSRLSYKGYGRTKPKEPIEDSPEKEQANRRVEVLVLEK